MSAPVSPAKTQHDKIRKYVLFSCKCSRLDPETRMSMARNSVFHLSYLKILKFIREALDIDWSGTVKFLSELNSDKAVVEWGGLNQLRRHTYQQDWLDDVLAVIGGLPEPICRHNPRIVKLRNRP